MPRFIELLQRFRRDDRGVFAVFFAIIALVLIATSGAVVDFTSIQQTRTRAQTALDSAALALQPRIAVDSITTLQTKAQTLLTQQLADASISATVGTPVVNTTDGSLQLTASVTKSTIFVRMVGITTLSANILSQATRKQLDLEVAMVLDNSGSMDTNSRMTNLKKAARCATDILYNSITACDDTTLNNSDGLTPTTANVKLGIAPFTEFVNVGTANQTATWMDQTGAAPVSKMGFDNDDNDANTFSANVNRFNLYTTLHIAWKGCVEARNHTTGAGGYYYDTEDLDASSGTPDSLYVPLFAQDQADGYADSYLDDRPSACTNKDQGNWNQVSTKTGCTNGSGSGTASATNYGNCTSTATTSRTQKDQNGAAVTPAAATEPTTVNGQPKVCADTYTVLRTQQNPNKYTYGWTRNCNYTFSDRELHERLCKYSSLNPVQTLDTTPPGGKTGPNADCGVELQPLTTTKSLIITKIGQMASSGGTNIHQGVVWGYNMLSPKAPLTEAKSYTSTTTKVMIVMTDGENTHHWTSDYAGADWYVAYGYPYTGRLTGTTNAALQTEMDNRTKTTCTNAKNAGITIYTIGLSAPNQSTKDMLTACANDSAHAYFPTSSTQLVATFQAIAGQLADLRLAK